MTAVLEPAAEVVDEKSLETWAWVQRTQKGDTEAFGKIYERYVDTVFRFIYFRVGHRQTAEDLCSEAFVRALKRIHSFTWQGRDLGAWLTTIARNLVADHFKSGRYRLEVSTGDVLDADAEDRGPEGRPESAVVEHLANVELLSALKRLERHSPEQYDCIVYRFLRGFSVAETAQAMGKNEGALKALQFRAVRSMSRMVELVDPADLSAGVTAAIFDRPGPAAVAAPVPAQTQPIPQEPCRDPDVDWTPAAQRAWAKANGAHVGRRGFLPGWLREAYAEAMGARS